MSTRYRPVPQSSENTERMQRMAIAAEKIRGRCRGCAFRSGTAANRCENVANAVELCALSGQMFHCHHAPERLCRGFDGLFIRPFQKDATR